MNIYFKIQDWLNIRKSTNIIHHNTKIVDKNHMLISMDVDKIQHSFLTKKEKNSNKIYIEENLVNMI